MVLDASVVLACYVELAIRAALPIASFDRAMLRAASAERVATLE
jgi:hypothetical protein